eukprot:scaffold846_cov252-Pinguiococcus_pyrenoidosus.AAC.8
MLSRFLLLRAAVVFIAFSLRCRIRYRGRAVVFVLEAPHRLVELGHHVFLEVLLELRPRQILAVAILVHDPEIRVLEALDDAVEDAVPGKVLLKTDA